MQIDAVKLEEIRQIAADALEIEPEEMTDTGHFQQEYYADSLVALAILAQLEKRYKVQIPQAELRNMTNLLAVYQVVSARAGWEA